MCATPVAYSGRTLDLRLSPSCLSLSVSASTQPFSVLSTLFCSDPYAVISYAYWKKRFGLDASIIGKSVQIHKTFFTIIGVAPPRFFGETVGDSPDASLPMMMEPLVKPGRDWLHDDPSKAEKVEWL